MDRFEPVSPGHKVKLNGVSAERPGNLSKSEIESRTLKLMAELSELQELLFAAGTHGLLIVLQGRDTSGKDGTIRHLLQCMNAQSTRVVPFKVPTPKELSHDFLWRVHAQTPSRGETVLFNRSHYEDVLVVRVHNLVPEAVWSKRYDQINQFEGLLAENSTILVKFCLHITPEEQESRLLDREKELEKAWKLSVGDWKEREFWDRYTEAYETALRQCSSDAAPWFIVPANSKTYRNYLVTRALVERLRPFRDEWKQSLESLGARAKAELEEYRKSKSDNAPA
ncbi:MAG TPA: hypothetical protein PLO61_04170 [Fimbriimonadaceae bacterium]|nr:hypothetical protein [Fimbriimonadaceae bacterium]HRJ32842.1 hypothetical protein [Fimbriimonadaceae bacterium]